MDLIPDDKWAVRLMLAWLCCAAIGGIAIVLAGCAPTLPATPFAHCADLTPEQANADRMCCFYYNACGGVTPGGEKRGDNG